jgi:phosphatidylglycerophosphate synthase
MQEPGAESTRRELWLERWSRANAFAMLASCPLALWFELTWLVSVIAAVSFGALLVCGRRAWTPAGRFGPANAITTVRIAGTVALSFAPPRTPGSLLALALLALLMLDGVDGWVARHAAIASSFGARFDMEADALLVFVADLELWHRGRLAGWVLITGVLRYLYVLLIALVPPPGGDMPRSRFGRYAFAALLLGLLAAFACPGALGTALAAGGSAAVVLSFARSFHWSYGRRSPPLLGA